MFCVINVYREEWVISKMRVSSAFRIVTGLLEMLSTHEFEKVRRQREKRERKVDNDTKERKKEKEAKSFVSHCLA